MTGLMHSTKRRFLSSADWLKSVAYKAIYKSSVNCWIPLNIRFQEAKLRARVKKGGRVRVCFFAMSLAMWRYQSVYERLMSDKRFEVYVVLSPSRLWDAAERERNLSELRQFFNAKGVTFIDWDAKAQNSSVDVRREINPDILFYPQQYKSVHFHDHCYRRFMNKLFCWCMYGMSVYEDARFYNTEFLNIAWKLFYNNQSELKAAERLADNKGRNVVITGYPNMTEYLSPNQNDVWKIKEPNVKRLIWAPHYSINPEGDELYRSNFLWMADEMVKLARQYADRLQIAFKPHPKLRTRLYEHPQWGREKTDEYYRLWAEMPNTQLETGQFIDLFKTSDAMVHDSASFQIEYLYVNKPVMYVLRKKIDEDITDISEKALECHYIGKSMDDIRRFVDMVFDGEDTMREKREQYYQQYLLPENGPDVGLNMYNEIITTLRLESIGCSVS